MCGLCGFFYRDAQTPISKDILDDMSQSLEHRGPDAKGSYITKQGAIGHRRLSIIDLQGGHQPMLSTSKAHILSTNGEIYNYQELATKYLAEQTLITSSDTEVMLQMLMKKGEEAISDFNGMFAFAYLNQETNTLLLGRDPVGQKPLFYYHDDNAFVFSSELTSLAQHPAIPKEIDLSSIGDYLYCESFGGSSTPFKGVKKALPGHYIELNLNTWSIRTECYWHNPSTLNKRDVSEKEYLDRFERTFESAVEKHLRSDVDVGVFLSGGLDSPALVKMASKLRGGPKIKTFTIRHEDDSFNEADAAKEVADYYGTEHHERLLRDVDVISSVEELLSTMDEPIADPGYIALYQAIRFSREHVKVVLSGNGGDEFWAGYTPFKAIGAYQQVHQWPTFLQKTLKHILGMPGAKHGYMNALFKARRFMRGVHAQPSNVLAEWMCAFNLSEIKQVVNDDIAGQVLSGMEKSRPSEYVDYFDEMDSNSKVETIGNTFLNQFQNGFLTNSICNHADKSSMSVAQELRSPFLDVEMMRLANQMPFSMKLRGNQTKYMLRMYLSKDAPIAVARKKKQGFTVPIAAWLNGPLKSWADDILSVDQLKQHGLFKPSAVRKLFDEHQNKKKNHAKALWTLIVMQHWLARNS
jgi:asparagine synthase (glutamine-hydrolysing)